MRKVIPDSVEVERQKMAILKVIASSKHPTGSKVIARLLKESYDIDLSERGVRYHLNLMDERGLTEKISRRDGRVITPSGLAEIEDAMVADKVGFVIDRIELLSYQVSFDPATRSGRVPVNISMIPVSEYDRSLRTMERTMAAGLCASTLVATAAEGAKIAGIQVPDGKVGFATVCSVIINSSLLKAGIPIDSRFGGILQFMGRLPLRFTDLIEYSGSTMDPSEIFIAGCMTSVDQAAAIGNGKILANFREIPTLCIDKARDVFDRLKSASISPPLVTGSAGKPVSGVPVGPGKTGLVLTGGLNPVAAAVEAGIGISSKAMSGLLDYSELVDFFSLAGSRSRLSPRVPKIA